MSHPRNHRPLPVPTALDESPPASAGTAMPPPSSSPRASTANWTNPMLTPFQHEVLQILAANRSPDSFIAEGTALNRDFPRLSGDIDIFHQTVAVLDTTVAGDRQVLERAGYTLNRIRET